MARSRWLAGALLAARRPRSRADVQQAHGGLTVLTSRRNTGRQRIRQRDHREGRRESATNQSFDKVNLQHVKDMLVEQICSLTGGGCAYAGDTMRDVHAGHHISNAEFFDLVEVLRESMRAQNVPLARAQRTTRDSRADEARHREALKT